MIGELWAGMRKPMGAREGGCESKYRGGAIFRRVSFR
jgi:hypothetical protein